ncbi:MAG: hypothetical protein JWO15_3857 [Sphingomonadales bacterium]|nr:hypothetical protein [Sphingomonadales bacterium]
MLSVRDYMTLTLAAQPYRYEAIRTTHARELLGYNETRFWARTNYLLDQPESASHPATARLLRIRDTRRSARMKRSA